MFLLNYRHGRNLDVYVSWFAFYFLSLLALSEIGMSGVVIYDGNLDVEEFSDLELSFTTPIRKNGIEGFIVAANPPHACLNISRPPELNISVNWFVLIAGNLCEFETKVFHSQLAGYSVAVIYSFRGKEERPFRNSALHYYDFANISAIVIRTIHGIQIKEKYLYTVDRRYKMFIYPSNSFNIMTFLLLFAIVAGLFLAIMLAFTVIWILLITCVYSHVFMKYYSVALLTIFSSCNVGILRFMQQSQSPPSSRLSSRHLSQLQTSRFSKGDQYETCAICLEDYNDKDKLRILPCSHGYHAKCIDPWLTNNQCICPVCKQKVVLGREYPHASSNYGQRTETTPLLTSQSNVIVAHGTFNSENVPASAYLSNNLTT